MGDFKNIRTLIIDPQGYTSSPLRTPLLALGTEIFARSTTEDALEVLRHSEIHIVFCDEDAGFMPPLEFSMLVRRDVGMRNVVVPIVLVSAAASHKLIVEARDCGMSDVICKPVSQETLERKLHSLVIEPRPFVVAKGFIGPDRRSRSGERRTFGERRPFNDRRGGRDKGEIFDVATLARSEEPGEAE
jgi:CheY-like chemotaxis protein